MKKGKVIIQKRKGNCQRHSFLFSHRYWLITIGLWLFTICFSLAQQNKIDSLLTLLKTDKPDTNKLLHLNKLTWELRNVGSYDSAMLFGNSALQLSNNILKNFSDTVIREVTLRRKASSYSNLGTIYSDQGNYPEALRNYLAALKINIEVKSETGIGSSYNNIGLVYYNEGNYPEALKNYFACLKIRETTLMPDGKVGDQKGIAVCYNNIGLVYFNQANYVQALKNYLLSLNIRKATGNKKGIGGSYNNIAGVYYKQGNYEEALKNHLQSLEIKKVIGDKSGIADSYNNIGLVYFAINKFNEALKNYFASLTIVEEIGDKAGIAISSNNIGVVFEKQKKYDEAKEYLLKAEHFSKEIGFKECLQDTYKALAELDSAKGNYAGAFENYKLYVLYRDSLDNEETRKQTIQSQMTFDFEKKEAVANAEHKKELENQEILAEEKSRKQNIVILFVVSGLLLVVVFAGFIFRSLRLTRKQKNIIELQKNLVEVQKVAVEQQKILVEEKQKEIIDSIKYARRIQRSLLPTEKFLDKTLKRLRN